MPPGWGRRRPPRSAGSFRRWPRRLSDLADFQVLLNGTAVDPRLIQYAGQAPGFAGLFQINLQLPADSPANPEIRIGFGANLSPAQRFLPVQ